MTTTLVLDGRVASQIEIAARNSLETAGVLLANYLEAPDGEVRLLGRSIVWVSDDGYIERESDRLSIASHGYVGALAIAEKLGAVPIWFHTHPGETGVPVPSSHDHEVDRQLADLFRLRSNAPFYGTLIASPRSGREFVFTGSLQPEHGPVARIDRLWRVGDDWRLTHAYDSAEVEILPIFDRNVRAFGPAIQGSLGDLRIAVVGCGGTGSAVAEQLVRLGIRRLMVIDADTLTASNVTRVYGSTSADVGKSKAQILSNHLRAIAPDLDCEAVDSMITLQSTARRLSGRDLVFGCTDDNAGRLVLSRIASYLLTPVIDVGVLLSSSADGILSGIDGRVTVLSPGSGCLLCRGRVDLARAAAELRTPDERQRLEGEGYAPALGRAEPAVVAYTTAVAAAAVNEFLERLIGYGVTPRPSEILLRLHEREISTNTMAPRFGHYCDPDSGKLGAGATVPFLEQLWPSE